MKVWCVTDVETAQLRSNGMLGVSVVVGTATLKPGDSMEVPSHLVAELQSAFRNGLLSTVEPVAKMTAVISKPAPSIVKTEPVPSVPVPTEPAESPPETPEPDNTEQRRRRR